MNTSYNELIECRLISAYYRCDYKPSMLLPIETLTLRLRRNPWRTL